MAARHPSRTALLWILTLAVIGYALFEEYAERVIKDRQRQKAA